MKYKSLVLMVLICYSVNCISQEDSMKFQLNLAKQKLLYEQDFFISASIRSFSSDTLYLMGDPFFFMDYNSDLGSVRLQLELLDENCYRPVEVYTDYFGKITPASIAIANEREVVKNGDLRKVFSLGKGNYRIRGYLVYKRKNAIIKSDPTKWIYFEILTNKYMMPG